MYPLTTERPYARNHWYVAGLSTEFGRTPVGRTILDDPLVFYRTKAGEPIALWGLCPHRLAPLELGSIKADNLVCGYHGFTFDAEGQCVSIPTAERIPSTCRLRRYPLVEQAPVVWIWMGDGRADESLLPDAQEIGFGGETGAWRMDPAQTVHLKARAQLLIDNLLDLSHLAFVHSKSAPNSNIALTDATVEESDGRIIVGRVITEDAPDSFTRFARPDICGAIQTTMNTTAYNHCLIVAQRKTFSQGPEGAFDQEVANVAFASIITPETPRTTHYFGVVSRNFRKDDDQLSEQFVAQNQRVRAEDVAILEAIERVANKHGSPEREISILPDAGALRFRRKIQAAIQAEEASGDDVER